MAGSVRTCCVPKCGKRCSDNAILHFFPHPDKDKNRFLTWINAVGQSVSSLPYEYIFRNKKICSDHFEERYKTWKGRLTNIAVPTLLMPGFQVDRITVMRDITNLDSGMICDNVALASTSTGSTVQPEVLNVNTAETESNKTLEMAQEPAVVNTIAQTKPAPANTIKKTKQQQKGAAFKGDTKILQKMLKKAMKKNDTYAARLKKARNLSENKIFQKILSKLTSLAALFITMQFREAGKKIMARRYTEEEKVMALSLYKYGPRLYRFMSRAFVLPSPLTLSRLIARANLRAGINEKLFKVLEAKIRNMTPDDKLCILLFDEVAITPHFDYNNRKDDVSGFVNNGNTKERKIADHALVFMIRGIVRNYKQPIAYTFCSGSTKKNELTSLIEAIIKKLHSIGLRVLATVCDQGASNVSCINNLIKKTKEKCLREKREMRREIFEIEGKEIIPLYDPPHLLKGIRNNFLTKNLKCTIDGETKIAKWEHLVLLHKEDPAYCGVRLLKKLTEQHINPEKSKMKVKFATQIFSCRVAATMGYLAGKKILPEECAQTADVLLFFDELFDSVNGSQDNARKRRKALLDSVKPGSIHNEVWAKSKKVLASMQFINSGREAKIPSINNWLHTINNIEYLRDVLFNQYNMKSIWMRHFNQDPLENFFGSVRSHGCRNINPTPEGFEIAFASLLISNLTGTHSPGYNCEKDSCLVMFKSMKELFEIDKKDNTSQDIDLNYINCDIFVNYNIKKSNPQIYAQLQYVAGYLLKKTRKNVFTGCISCKNNFYTKKEYEYLRAREHNKNKRCLHYPNEEFIKTYSIMQDIATWVLQNHSDIKNLRNYITTIMYLEINMSFNNCKKHRKQNTEYLFNLVARFFIFNWCKNINNILGGRSKEKSGTDLIKNLAIEYVNKRRKPN